ncbi:MAG: glycosyltransferase family 39 protein [Bacteroidales bacterium]|nr:glycosyltransferase family 39 protein [Bacteroidales bacterium]
MFKNISEKEWLIISIFIVIKLLLHFFTSTNYDIHRDTFLYYSLSENLDWGYASVPPFIGVIARVSTFLFGYSAFSLNIFPAMAGAISLLLIALIIKEFGGSKAALFTAMLAFLLSPAYLRSNSLLQPVSFDQLFWLWSAYLIVRMIHSGNTHFWIWIMIVWGVGVMTKYLMVGYAFSFLLAILISQHRKLLFSKHFLIGALLAFIIILPNIIWQYNHNWAVLHHLSELGKNQLINVSYEGFLVDQVMMNFPGLIVWLTGLIVFLFLKKENNYRVLALASVFIVLLLMLTHGKSYYTLGAYTYF